MFLIFILVLLSIAASNTPATDAAEYRKACVNGGRRA